MLTQTIIEAKVKDRYGCVRTLRAMDQMILIWVHQETLRGFKIGSGTSSK